jgi:hypothetical protein
MFFFLNNKTVIYSKYAKYIQLVQSASSAQPLVNIYIARKEKIGFIRLPLSQNNCIDLVNPVLQSRGLAGS